MNRLLAGIIFAATCAFGQISIGIQIGAPPPPRVIRVLPPSPGPDFVWIQGYWYPSGRHYAWHAGYWTRPVYPGARWVGPRYDGGRYYAGFWDGGEGRREHDHHWDRGRDRDFGDHDRGRGRGRGRGHDRD